MTALFAILAGVAVLFALTSIFQIAVAISLAVLKTTDNTVATVLTFIAIMAAGIAILVGVARWAL